MISLDLMKSSEVRKAGDQSKYLELIRQNEEKSCNLVERSLNFEVIILQPPNIVCY